MEIVYQIELNNNPSIKNPQTGYIKALVPLSIEEIANLENSYNNGNQFPDSLRELLYLAGNYCYVLDYGLFDKQEQLQDGARNWLTKYGRTLSIVRPFFVIDVYNANEQFLFIYLDEGVNDPMINEAYLEPINDGSPWLRSINKKLSEYINIGIAELKSGLNPF
ncbi:MAG: hypothetical protein ACXVAY_19060 [Mucilaginibacter sp.]